LAPVDPRHLIETFGTVGLIAIVFAESGLFFAFFLPGDSLLVTAGLLAGTHRAGQPHLNLAVVLAGCAAAAFAGNQVGYWFGHRVGPALFTRGEARLFKPQHLARAHEYFARQGPRTIVLARFVPGVRTFAPIVAGVSEMSYGVFVTYNLVGTVLWALGVTLAGYELGSRVSGVDRYLAAVIGGMVALSLLPMALEAWRAADRREKDPVSGG